MTTQNRPDDKFSEKYNREQLISFLVAKGFTEKIATGQIDTLSDIVYLSALKKLAEKKNINVEKLGSLSPDGMRNFLKEHFTSEEIVEAVFSEMEVQFKGFLSAIDSA